MLAFQHHHLILQTWYTLASRLNALRNSPWIARPMWEREQLWPSCRGQREHHIMAVVYDCTVKEAAAAVSGPARPPGPAPQGNQ